MENGRTLYISDTHFGHRNIILYDNRPFETCDEMTEGLVERWNGAVSDDDTVYVLGDFCWRGYGEWVRILSRLNGHVYFIKGNHDKRSYLDRLASDASIAGKVIGWSDYKEINDSGRQVVLSHYYIHTHNGMHSGSYHLYGHVHCSYDYNICLRMQKATEALYKLEHRVFNVGAMVGYIGYTPRSLDEIVAGYRASSDGSVMHASAVRSRLVEDSSGE